MPQWLDDEAWQQTHKFKNTAEGAENRRGRASFLKKYPNWEDFKKYCYDMAQRKRYDICTDESGWCTECARNDDWEFDKARKPK